MVVRVVDLYNHYDTRSFTICEEDILYLIKVSLCRPINLLMTFLMDCSFAPCFLMRDIKGLQHCINELYDDVARQILRISAPIVE